MIGAPLTMRSFFIVPSESSGGWGSTPNAFIFSLRNNEGLAPFKSMVKYPSSAIYRSSNRGPYFGKGPDFNIANNAGSSGWSSTSLGHSYHAPSEVKDSTTILAGTHSFAPDDWEVFYLDTTGAKIH